MDNEIMHLANLAGMGNWNEFQVAFQAFLDTHGRSGKHGEILPQSIPSVTLRRLNRINAMAVVYCN